MYIVERTLYIVQYAHEHTHTHLPMSKRDKRVITHTMKTDKQIR